MFAITERLDSLVTCISISRETIPRLEKNMQLRSKQDSLADIVRFSVNMADASTLLRTDESVLEPTSS